MCEPGILSCSVASTHLQGGRGGFQVPGAKALKVGSELAPFPLLCSLTHWHLYPRGQQSSSRRGQNRCLVQARAHAGPPWHTPVKVLDHCQSATSMSASKDGPLPIWMPCCVLPSSVPQNCTLSLASVDLALVGICSTEQKWLM